MRGTYVKRCWNRFVYAERLHTALHESTIRNGKKANRSGRKTRI